MVKSLSVLFTIQTMEGPAGGSLYVRDLALELMRRGHRPFVYCRRLGEPAWDLERAGVPVLDSIDRVPRPDIIHGNSPIETAAVILRFPETPALFVCHGLGPDALPPGMPGILRYLAVSEYTRDVLISQAGAPEDLVILHQNAVDLERFPLRPALPARPKRALVFSNTLSERNYLGVLREACAAFGLTVDVMGLGTGTARNDPERVLGDYDVVFAKGRAALEALATGCAVVLADAIGLGEMVTTDNYDLLRLRNFGLRVLQLPPTTATAMAQLKRYDPADAAEVTARVRRHEGLYHAAETLIGIYHSVISEFRTAPRAGGESLRLAAARFLDQIAPRANTFHLAEQLASVERQEQSSGVKLRRLRETLEMKPLDEAALSQIRIRRLVCPGAVAAGGYLDAAVEVENGSGAVLASLGAYAVHLSYHWLGQGGEVLVHDGRRSELFPPLPPGGSYRYSVRVQAPATPGACVLRLTLVQEDVAWLDRFGAYSDVACEVLA